MTNADEHIKENKADSAQSGELETCAKERDEYLNGWKRAKADLINYQKDEEKRFEEFAKFATLDFMRECITVLDSFDLAISVFERSERDAEAVKGMHLIRGQIEEILKRRGVERIEIPPGSPFDPSRAESVGELESGHSPGSVAEVVARGYIMEGRVVRPARVRIAKQPKTNT